MTIEVIMQMISNYIFPVVACVALAWYFSKVNEQYRQDIKELTASHKEESKQLADAVNNNTAALQRLIDRMEDLDDR